MIASMKSKEEENFSVLEVQNFNIKTKYIMGKQKQKEKRKKGEAKRKYHKANFPFPVSLLICFSKKFSIEHATHW